MMRVALLVMALALSGCSGAEDDHHDGHMDDGHHDGGGEGNLAYTGQEDVQVTIVAGEQDEFRFVPDNFTVQQGQTVGITFRNQGDIDHELALNDFGVHVHLEPGETGQVAFAADEAGTFAFGCYIPGHFEAGMKGNFVVQ